MDSKAYVPLFTTKADPRKCALSSSSSASTGSLPIRAPPTIDSDSESIGDKTSSTSSSGDDDYNGCESYEAFLIGEEFEMASERPWVADPDEEAIDSESFELSRPFVADPDRKSLGNSIEDEEESGVLVGEYGPVVEPILVDNLNLNRVMPKAQLSLDDDEEEEMVSIDGEDSEFSGTVRVPGIDVLGKIGGAPTVKALGVDEDELVEWRDSLIVKQYEPAISIKVVEAEVSDESVEAQFGILGAREERALKESGEDSVLAEVIEDMGPDVVEMSNVESLIANGEYVMEESQKLTEDVVHSGEEKGVDKEGIELGMNEGQRETVEYSENGAVTMKSSTQREPLADADEANEAREETFITVNETDVVSSDTEECIDLDLFDGNGSLTRLEKQSSVTNGFVLREVETVIGAYKNLESKMGSGIDLGVGSSDFITCTQVELSDAPKGNEYSDSHSAGSMTMSSSVANNIKRHDKDEANFDACTIQGAAEGNEGSLSVEDPHGLILGSFETVKSLMHECEKRQNSSFLFDAEGSRDHSQRVGGQIGIDSDKEVDGDGDGECKQLFDYAELEAFLKAATVANSEERPTGLGSSFHSMRPSSRLNRPNFFYSDLRSRDDFEDNLSEEEMKKTEKIQLIRVKFLRLVQRLGISLEDSRVSRVLYRLALDTRSHSSQISSLESVAKRLAMQLEAEGKDDLDFSLNIVVMGKCGVGKSATINSIFDEEKAIIGAFEPATTTVKEIVGTIDGVRIRLLDTPGLSSSSREQSINLKILASIKKFSRKFPPDIVLYVDRLDTSQIGDLIDFPLLKSITLSLGSSIWLNAVVTLTHAASAPSDGQSGLPLDYDKFVSEQSNAIQQSINQAVGDLGPMNPGRIHPVCLVENHPSCQENSFGQRVLPNGLIRRPHLLLMFYSIKILSEANPISIPSPTDLLASFLQPYAHPKLSGNLGGDEMYSDIKLANLLDSKEENEYDQLPPFMPLRKSQVAELSKKQRKAYLEEYDYRVKLFQKKQLKRSREMKKKRKDGGKNYAVGHDHSTFGLSLVQAAGDMSLVANLRSEFSIGRCSKMAIHVGLNEKRRWQITVRTSSSEQLQIVLFSILPTIAGFIFRRICPRFDLKNSEDV
ncbi:translocase of chloroplast 159, chloroplastic-like [Juglans regia]|uniref:Translocase of chloroplast 159, chloroplastic-like n=1 Tax=Juglans regia TaxID=51240 RepID=A0A6P9EMD5_JUGRE|nr:translocase of chloroplast 159, chloroplastic-like [Juglans regia]